ncbi:hypothetical protein [Nonomuraea typhae]|uniref:Uncharacterized protein n=1 Tax=Nonomuraea typhae TaxID=2603600 RepID=A0ABW7YLT1_9ACTN
MRVIIPPFLRRAAIGLLVPAGLVAAVRHRVLAGLRHRVLAVAATAAATAPAGAAISSLLERPPQPPAAEPSGTPPRR